MPLFDYAGLAFTGILLIMATQADRKKLRAFVGMLGLTYLTFGFAPWKSYIELINAGREDNYVGMSRAEFERTPEDKLLTRIGDEPYQNIGKRAIILGKRLDASNVPKEASAKLRHYIIDNGQ